MADLVETLPLINERVFSPVLPTLFEDQKGSHLHMHERRPNICTYVAVVK